MIPIIILTPKVIVSINGNDPALRIATDDCIAICMQTAMYAFLLNLILKIENKKVRNVIISVVVLSQILI